MAFPNHTCSIEGKITDYNEQGNIEDCFSMYQVTIDNGNSESIITYLPKVNNILCFKKEFNNGYYFKELNNTPQFDATLLNKDFKYLVEISTDTSFTDNVGNKLEQGNIIKDIFPSGTELNEKIITCSDYNYTVNLKDTIEGVYGPDSSTQLIDAETGEEVSYESVYGESYKDSIIKENSSNYLFFSSGLIAGMVIGVIISKIIHLKNKKGKNN